MTTHRSRLSGDDYLPHQKARLRSARAWEDVERAENEGLKARDCLPCPKCGMALETVTLQGVRIEHCFSYTGNWRYERDLE